MNYYESNYVQSAWKPLKPAMSEKEVSLYILQGDNPAKAISDHVEDLVENERRKVSLVWTAIVLILLVCFASGYYVQHKHYNELKNSINHVKVANED